MTTAQNAVDLAKRQVERNEALLKAGAIAERDLELAQNQLLGRARRSWRTRKAQLANAQKQLSKATVVAPFTGVVSARQVSAGDVVQPGGALYTIVNPSTMRLEASVPADQLSAVRVGAPVDFTVNGYPNRAVHGPRHAHQSGRRSDDAPGADHRLAAERERRAGRRPVRRRPRGERSAHGAGRSDRGGGRARAQAVRDADQERRRDEAEVELGIRDAATETVEVARGVQPGDTILLGAARGISEKTPVKVSATSDTGRKH